MRFCPYILALLLAAGCATNHKASSTTQPVQADAGPNSFTHIAPRPSQAALDARPGFTQAYVIHVFRLSVPANFVSGNAAFWKPIDETAVDPGTYDLLYKNGVRVGTAPLSEFEAARTLLAGAMDAQGAKRSDVLATRAQQVEVEMKTNLPEQILFYFESLATGTAAVGRTYGECDNVFYLAFQPVPRAPDEVELSITPAVKTHRKRMEFTVRGNEQELTYASPESLYPLNLRVDLPLDRFMVVAPSPGAQQETSIGRAFLTQDDPTQRRESVLVIVPQVEAIPKGVQTSPVG